MSLQIGRMGGKVDVMETNDNAIFIGGSGAGKSLRVVKPNAMALSSAYIFTDPKGELLRDMGAYLQAHGYVVRSLNLVDMDLSDK